MSMKSVFWSGPVALLFALLALTLTPLRALAQVSSAHTIPTQPRAILPSGVWLLTGNSGILSGFLGTTDKSPLEIRINNHRAMHYEFVDNSSFGNRSVNILGGSEVNSIAAGMTGATIAGGGGQDAFSGVGFPNRILADFGTIGGGFSNSAGLVSTVAGGSANNASGDAAAIAGGEDNEASGGNASVGGGVDNEASGFVATIPGGVRNAATGDYSFAAGRRAKAIHTGSFVWADSTDANLLSTGADQFLIRAHGGVGINTNDPAGQALNVNGTILCTSLTQSSDARFKTNIATVDNALDTILKLRGVTFEWNREQWKERSFTAGRQIGFIAQEVEKVLPELVSADVKGYKSVAYANVVPVLVEAVKAQQQQIDALKAQRDTDRSELNALEAQLKEMDTLKAQLSVLTARLTQMDTEKVTGK